MNIKAEVEKWRQKAEYRDVIERMSETELIDSFGASLEFGTGGIRGILGPGPNRMNVDVVRRVSFALGTYLTNKYTKIVKVAIAYDNRNFSKDFALVAAKTLTHFGIRTFVFSTLRPTPELSFAVRTLGCQSGIVITASHNPKEYNGYKVYDQTGCQLNLTDSALLIEQVNNTPHCLDLEVNEQGSLLTVLDDFVDIQYLKALEDITFRPIKNSQDLKIVYTPLHGAAYPLVMRSLQRREFDVYPVTAQSIPDGNFSATKSANPEDPLAYEKAIELARQVGADLVMATDPDGDRIGIVVLHNNEYHFLNGNQTGGLLIDYVLSALQDQGTDLTSSIVYNTIVTSPFGAKIARHLGADVFSTLTGFKFIGEQIQLNLEREDGKQFVFGYEESYGYLLNPMCRDKDAVQASLAIAEMACYYKEQGITLIDRLHQLFQQHGFHQEDQINIALKGLAGQEKIKEIMTGLRKSWLMKKEVCIFEDYLNQVRVVNGHEEPISLPKSNVLKFIFKNGSFIAVRPSGTEPKLKIYFAFSSDQDNCQEVIEEQKAEVRKVLQKKFGIK